MAKADDISPHTAKTRPEVKAIVATISDLPEDEKREVARELAQDPNLRNEVVGEANRQMDKKRRDHRRDHGPRKEHKTGLEDLGIATTCPLIDMYLDQLEGEVGDGVGGEALELLKEYLDTFEMKIAAIRAKVSDTDSWDSALKEIV